MNSLVKIGALLSATLIAAAALWGLATRMGPEVRALQEEKRQLLEQRARLQDYLARLTQRRRVAQVLITGQAPDAAGRLSTTLTFQEVDEQERPITSQSFTVPSEFVYFDALVIRFEESLVGSGDPERGKSLALFRRVFGESQPPEEGPPIDPPNAVPARFRSGPEPSLLEKQLWRDFWLYVRRPEKAREVGIRVAQCEAVGAPVKTGDFWVLELESAGGLNLIRHPLPGLIQQMLRGEMPTLGEAFNPPGAAAVNDPGPP